MRKALIGGLVALGVGVGVLVLSVVAWAFDVRAHRGRVERNVTLAGYNVGGLGAAGLEVAVGRVSAKVRGVPVEVRAPGGGFATDTTSLGVAVSSASTERAVLRAGRHGAVPARFWGWVTSFAHPIKAPVRISVDPTATFRVVAGNDPGPKTAPTEPSIVVKLGHLVAVGGKDGHGIDPRRVLAGLPGAVASGTPIVVRVDRGDVAPRWTITDAAKVARDGDALVTSGLTVTAGAATATVTTESLRSWLTAQPADDGLHLAVDPVRATADLATLLPKAGTAPVETTFAVVNDVPQAVAGTPGTACCAPSSADVLRNALERRHASGATTSTAPPVVLPLKTVNPALTADAVAALGIKEDVSTFTTHHPCCAPRVSNIHRIADLVRGQIIKPGETFSVNALVGPRTTAKGFVVDHVIEDGKFAESVGGGISQFGTTTFNAAFFAGLELPEYMAHTIYISRYPFGREATLSFPHPDLKIHNVSPYGILIWPTYTGTSLTVTFYSTHWVDAAQTDQTKKPAGPNGQCTAVRTQRTRKFLDGTTKLDYFTALYQPAEGVLCR